MNWEDPNLWFEGLGGAIVSGIVAAVTALVVVRLTDRGGRKLANELDARQEAVGFVRATNAFITQVVTSRPNTHDLANQRTLAHVHWTGELVASLAALKAVDDSIGATIQGHVDRAGKTVTALAKHGSMNPESAPNPEWDQKVEALTTDLLIELNASNLDVINWLTNRRR